MSSARGIWGLLLLPAACSVPAPPAPPEEFFNGRDLAGWEGRRDVWTVETGEIVGKASPLMGVEYLVHPRPVGDFRLTLEVKLAGERGNGGIQFRSRRFKGNDMQGYQADVGPGAWGRLIERHGRGPLAGERSEIPVRPGDWNLYEILAVGSRIQLALNGRKCADFTDPQAVRDGLIGLQMAGEIDALEIRFRRLTLERDPAPVLKTVR